MFGLSTPVLLGLAAAIFLGGTVKGISGVGLPVITMAIIVNFIDPKLALAVISMPILVTNLWQTVRAGDVWKPIKRFWLMLVVLAGGMWVGARIVATVDSDIVFAVVGFTVIVFTASNVWTPPSWKLGPTAERILGPFIGVVSGVMGGMTSVWGPPLMMYVYMLRLTKDEWVQTFGALYLCGAVPLTVFYWQSGILNSENIWLSVAACVPVMIGIRAGERIRKWIDEDLFRKLLLLGLFLAGLNLLRRAFF